MYGGELKTSVRCASCHHVVHRTDNFTSLQLHMKSPIHSLNDLMKVHFKSERCPSDYQCCNERCSALGTCDQKIEILKWPRVLLIHLKRWRYNEFSKSYQKVDEALDCPSTYAPTEHVSYNLRSTVVHVGQPGFGATT